MYMIKVNLNSKSQFRALLEIEITKIFGKRLKIFFRKD